MNTDISGSALIRHGASTINLSGGTGRNRQLQEGPDTVTNVLTGELIEHRQKFNSYFNKDPYLSASWALERGSDNAIRLNARWQPSSFDLFQNNRVTPVEASAARRQSLPALSPPGDRAWRRRHASARRRRDQAGRRWRRGASATTSTRSSGAMA